MDTPQARFDETYMDFIDRLSKEDLASDSATTFVRNLETLSRCRPQTPEPEPTPEPVPTTVWGKVKAGASCAWNNETTQVTIKAVGAFAGVALVVYSTIQKDHVLERQALAQANQTKI